MTPQTEAEYREWCERHKWQLRYPPTHRDWDVAWKIQGAYLARVAAAHPDWEFSMEASVFVERRMRHD